MDIKRLNSSDSDFQSQLDALLAWESVSDDAVFNTVKNILSDVRSRGDAAVLEYTKKFDRLDTASMADLTIGADRLKQAYESIEPVQREALECAAQRVRTYHDKQKMESWCLLMRFGHCQTISRKTPLP